MKKLSNNLAVMTTFNLLAGVVTGFIATFAHRAGAAYNIPYGLVLAFLIVGLSAWAVRQKSALLGLLTHFIGCVGIVWGIALTQTSSDAIIVVGGASLTTFWSLHAGYIWIYGVIALHVVLAILPSKLFMKNSTALKGTHKHGMAKKNA